MMPTQYRLNGFRDLAMDGDIKRYIGEIVEEVKVLKSGLVQIKTADGQLFSVAKYNLDPV